MSLALTFGLVLLVTVGLSLALFLLQAARRAFLRPATAGASQGTVAAGTTAAAPPARGYRFWGWLWAIGKTLVALLILTVLVGAGYLLWSSWPIGEPRQQATLSGLYATQRQFEEGTERSYLEGKADAQGIGPEIPPGQRPGQQRIAQRKPFFVEQDGSGGARITVHVPEANFVRTGLTFRHGEVFYISTPHFTPNLQVGILKKVGDQEEIVWAPVPANELWSSDQPHRMRLESAPEAELCFGTAAVPRGTHVLYARKSSGPLGPLEYTPGVPLARVLY